MPKISHINGKYCGTAPKINYYSNRFHKAMFSPLVGLIYCLGESSSKENELKWVWNADPIPVARAKKKKPSHGSPPRHWHDFVLVVAILRNCFSKEISAHESRPEFRLPLNPRHDTLSSDLYMRFLSENGEAARNEAFSFLSSYVSSFKIYVNSTNNQPQVSIFFFSPLHPSVAFMPTLQSLH